MHELDLVSAYFDSTRMQGTKGASSVQGMEQCCELPKPHVGAHKGHVYFAW